MIRKILLFSTLLIALSTTLKAQRIEISPFAGYTFADIFSITGGTARIGDGFTYGGSLAIAKGERYFFELTYLRTDMILSASSSYSYVDVEDAGSSNYILLGGNRTFGTAGKVVPYAGISVGMGILASKEDTFENIEKLAFGLDAGIKIPVSDKLGIRLQSNLNFPFVNVDGVLWWSASSGNSVVATSNVPFL
ncbi:MAG: hypothetical protein HGA37_13045, partial [Lentimicrobium sp.]|nr:hypothetical protein [Lentimicrobium sp.]